MIPTADFFEHTADLGLRIVAEDPSGLFRAAAEKLFDCIVANRDEVEPREVETVELRTDSIEDLFLAWLNELIFRCETRHRLYSRFDVTVSADLRALNGTIAGEPIDATKHVLDHEVKAATRHGLLLEKTEEGWKAEVIVDI